MFARALRSARRATVKAVISTTVVVGTLEVTTHLPSQGRSSEFYHRLCDEWITPAMRRMLDPEVAHNVAIYLTQKGLSPQHHPSAIEQRITVESTVFGKTFPNPIGLAAGFDKDGVIIPNMLLLGFGFVEIGTVTPQPQAGNPKPRMFRLPTDLGIINRYGFNSQGAAVVAENLKAYRTEQQELAVATAKKKKETSLFSSIWSFLYPPTPIKGIVGVNIGKNKTTESAVADYISNIQLLGPYADYLVINVSSPNTPGLRDLQEGTQLKLLLEECLRARNDLPVDVSVPLLVKLAPDLTDSDLEEIAAVCLETGIDGIVVSNTTKQRPDDLVSHHRMQDGGLSGKPVKDKSTDCIRKLYAETKGKIPIIGVGGVGSGQDAYEKLRAGASLVQVYSMLVYSGPGIVSRIRHELAGLMLQNGQRSIEDVVGLDHEDIFWQKRQERVMRNRQAEDVLVADKV